ncbi:hexuronate transporter [Azorhizobium oxalatiphilum]|uniref:Hexuronate transporter n=1 Tax=Azorhizobium oxalatiphilum TaxID=980631 RepID=A0A917CDA7_9HYPH|nr:MFS transporter [Azorhizobium oxalatiphilum]GGF80496.1 hexuronate transporter [Azorhizobium oxalatiphilum]
MAATRYRWFVIFLLFTITVVNYIDRAAISYAITDIEQTFGLSKGASGAILGAFGVGYAVTTLIGGFAVDRYGARLILTIAAVLWSISIGATALAGGFLSLMFARVLLGVSEGPNFPALTGAVKHWLAPHERVAAFGYALVAVPIALAIGGPIVTHLLAWFEWRATFAILFLASVVWVPLWWIFFRNDPSQSRFVNEAELAHIRTPDAAPAKPTLSKREGLGKALITNPTLLANYWAFFVFGYFLFFFMTWLPSYLKIEGGGVYGLNLEDVGLFTVAPWLCAAVSLWAMSHWSDYLLKKTGRLRVARSYLIAGSQLIAALAVIPVAFTHDLWMGIFWISIAVAASMGPNAAFYAVNVDVAPQRAASALGIMDFAFAISGFLAPTLTGWVLDIRGSFTDAFLLMAGLSLSSVVVVLLFHHPDRHRT